MRRALGRLFRVGSLWVVLVITQITGSAQTPSDQTLIDIKSQRLVLYELRALTTEQRCSIGNEFWRCGVKAQQALARWLDHPELQYTALGSASGGYTNKTVESWINGENLRSSSEVHFS